MLSRFSSEKIFCGLDIGSQRIKASLVRAKDAQDIQLLDVYENKTSGFRDDLWLDMSGSPLTSAGKMTERIRRRNYGSLEIELTVDDPKVYTKPWTVLLKQHITLGTELLDEICLENERSVRHMVGK